MEPEILQIDTSGNMIKCDIEHNKITESISERIEEVNNVNESVVSQVSSKDLTTKAQKSKLPSKKKKPLREKTYESTKLEDNSAQVLERFRLGCECHDDRCFGGLNPEVVYRHRLNIAELTKAEHDMYLMGVTMACLTNPYETAKHRERRRLRAQYAYQGRRVCLDAFLYLENCTHYQIKRIRKHLMTHGVTPRVHGNHGKIPHNTFSLDIYQNATEFLKEFVSKQELKQKTKAAKNAPLHLPSDITRKTVHEWYTEYCRKMSPDVKIMGYSTFRRFMKVQFPQVKFAKLEFVRNSQFSAAKESNELNKHQEKVQLSLGNGTELLPVLMTSDAMKGTTYYVTPVDKFQSNYQITSNGVLVDDSGLSLTIASINNV